MGRCKVAIALLSFALAIGCHAQVPPTNHVVDLSWTAPSGCTGCTFVISRAPAASGICPPSNASNYAPLNQNAPVSGTTYTDSSASGLNACYIAQTLQGAAVSVPSNTVGPLSVPANPLAPTLNNPTTAQSVAPQMQPSGIEVGQLSIPPMLKARLR